MEREGVTEATIAILLPLPLPLPLPPATITAAATTKHDPSPIQKQAVAIAWISTRALPGTLPVVTELNVVCVSKSATLFIVRYICNAAKCVQFEQRKWHF